MAPKRKGAFAAAAAKKSRQNTSLVVDTIAHAESLPANLRSLLKSSLPIVLNAYKADRHGYENEVVKQAEQALSTAQKALEAKHQESLGAQNVVINNAESNKRIKAKKDADTHLEKVKAQQEAEKAGKKNCEKAVEDAESAVKQASKDEKSAVSAAQKDESGADRELAKVASKKASLDNALAVEFVALMNGTSAAAAGKKAVSTLLSLGKEFGLDSTLLSTLPITCKKEPTARSDFEGMVFTKLQELISQQIAALAKEVAAAQANKANKAAATAAAAAAGAAATANAKNVLAQAQAALTAAETALENTQNAHKEASQGVSKADKHRRQIWEDMRQACDKQDKLANDVKDFKENVWGAFGQQKNKEPEPEPVEVEEPPAAVEEAAPAPSPRRAEAAPAPAAESPRAQAAN